MFDKQLIADLYSDFTKEELLNISKEFGLNHQLSDKAKDIVQDLLQHAVDKKPNTAKRRMSDLAYELLLAAEIINEDGEYVFKPSEKKVEISATKEEVEEKLPECFGAADKEDPACMRCKVLEACEKKRIKNRPVCYGKGYEKSSAECEICIEAVTCSAIVEGRKE
jgi:hypothetical protein